MSRTPAPHCVAAMRHFRSPLREHRALTRGFCGSKQRPAGGGGLVMENQKRAGAAAALQAEVKPGMLLGLGSGSTAVHMVDLLGELVRGGLEVRCVPTSEKTAAQARGLGIPLTDLDAEPQLDLTIDGADEIG